MKQHKFIFIDSRCLKSAYIFTYFQNEMLNYLILLTMFHESTSMIEYKIQAIINSEDCVKKILRNNVLTDVILVNFEEDYLTKSIHETMKYKILNRGFLSTKLGNTNEAYVIYAKNYDEIRNGLDDLVRDYFWNPRAHFIIIIEELTEEEIIDTFKALHHLYVFRIVLVILFYDTPVIYTYDFSKADHCTFTSSAMDMGKCENEMFNRSLNQTSPSAKLLISPDRRQIPYSGCNATLLVIPLIPHVFPDTADKKDKIYGYEEIYYKIMKDMGFINFTFKFPEANSVIGLQTKNYTVTGMMRNIVTGSLSGMVGGLMVASDRVGVFDFVYPHNQDNLLLFVSRALHLEKWKVILISFQSLVWFVISITFYIVCVFAIAFKVYGSKISTERCHVVFLVSGYFVGATPKTTSSNNKSRFVLTSWALFTWLLSCFYLSNLASLLTTPPRYPQIDTIEKVVELQYKFHVLKRSYDYAMATTGFFLSDLIRSVPSETCDTIFQCLEDLSHDRRGLGMGAEALYRFYEPAFVDKNLESKFYVLSPPILRLYTAAYFKKGFPDLERIRFLESQIIAGELYHKDVTKILFSNYLKYFYNKKYRDKDEALNFKDLEGIFYLLLCGCLVSFIVFMIEVFIVKEKTHTL